MKKILGLDLGTNSIGWALINHDFKNKKGEIIGMGSRIIPMDQTQLSDFGKGNSISQTAGRTDFRGTRRLYQRDNLRRERLHRVLNILGFLPEHYSRGIDFEKHFGQFKDEVEIKLNYRKNDKDKHEFIFMDAFSEMVKEFEVNGQNTRIPYDWTLYYLRKKALTQKVSKEELSWIILNFNQKRGYYQLRGEEEEISDGKKKEFIELRVKELIDSGDEVKGNKLYDVVFENGWPYDRQITKTENWINKTKEFIVTTSTTKSGDIKYSYKAVDSEKDWIAIKTKTEQDIDKSDRTVGEYIYEILLKNPSQKIRGKLVKTIERKFYKNEFAQILKTQISKHLELQDRNIYNDCINELYSRNEAHQNNIKDKGFEYLFLDDIIFYQRPLKSKKSTISGCQYETRTFKKVILDKATNVENKVCVTEPLKAIPKSHPLFQEFRLWQFLKNLKIYQKENEEGNFIDKEITNELLQTEDDWVALFDFLNEKKEVEQKNFVQYFVSAKLIDKKQKDNYRWNYVEDKKYPCNETKAQFVTRLKKVKGIDIAAFLTSGMEYKLWHIIYSVNDKNEFEQAIKHFAERNDIDKESFENSFDRFPPYKSEYGAYSEKAIKKLLPLMRRGRYWNEEAISQEVRDRIATIKERLESINYDEEVFKKDKHDRLRTIADDAVPKQLLKSFLEFKDKNHLEGMNTYQACYAIYERHSEAGNIAQWRLPSDIDKYLKEFKQHSLRNPIVEQIVTETLRTVRDIWKYYGKGNSNFFSEVHVELGRDMKNPASKRVSMSKQNTENENTNNRIKEILKELMNDPKVEGDVKPYSPSQQEILKIYEEGIFQNPDADYIGVNEEDITKIRKNSSPTKTEINKYKLWLEQGYVSPYTGELIPLSSLFTIDYQIEHIIPQSRYFDNSMSNKVICESAINPNPYKDNQTGFEFIKKQGGQIVPELSTSNRTVKLQTLEEYESHCNKYFKKNRTKLKNLLSEDIPEGFINRQLNDSRYISTLIKGLLSNLVREDHEKEATSKHIVPVTGAITSKLKQDWGLNDKWNELIAPRFERLNKLITKEGEKLSTDFGYWDQQITDGKSSGKKFYRTQVPDNVSKDFNKKRIDHRHHAMDALVIACCTKSHTNYLGALNAEKNNYGLRDSLLQKSKQGHYTKHFLQPWAGFTINTKSHLEAIIVTFKQNLRVINKTNNKTWQWVEKEGKLNKQLVPQTKGNNWAIRKSMHKETVGGSVKVRKVKIVSFSNGLKDWKNLNDKNLRVIVKSLHDSGHDPKSIAKYFRKKPYQINGNTVSKVEVYYFTGNATATRTSLTVKFTRKQLESVTDSGIRKILENHLKNYIDEKGEEQFAIAFSPEGIESLNKNINELNGGKAHHPIFKVRLYEEGNKFIVGTDGNKRYKFVEAAKGTNLFFAIYWNEDKQKREYETIPFNEVVEFQKWRATLSVEERKMYPLIPINSEKGSLLFSLSPNDLVYIPTDEEVGNVSLISSGKLEAQRIYKMVSTTGGECHFIPYASSKEIVKNENGTNSKSERLQDFFDSSLILDENEKPVMIKRRCWKIQVDRLGNIVKLIR